MSENQDLRTKSQDLVKAVSEDVIRHGFAEPLTEAGEGYEWAWVNLPSSYKGWWVAVKGGCTPFEVRGFSLNEIDDGAVERWIARTQQLQGLTVVQVGEWWVAVKCDG
jgi:hypothetical protein